MHKIRHDNVLGYSPRTEKFNHGYSIKQILGTSMTKVPKSGRK